MSLLHPWSISTRHWRLCKEWRFYCLIRIPLLWLLWSARKLTSWQKRFEASWLVRNSVSLLWQFSCLFATQVFLVENLERAARDNQTSSLHHLKCVCLLRPSKESVTYSHAHAKESNRVTFLSAGWTVVSDAPETSSKGGAIARVEMISVCKIQLFCFRCTCIFRTLCLVICWGKLQSRTLTKLSVL